MLSRVVLILCLGLPVTASFFLPMPGDPASDFGPAFAKVPCCAFRYLTGIPCPLCGLTRSFISLGHGRVRDSFLYHFLGPALFASFAAGAVAAALPRRARAGPGDAAKARGMSSRPSAQVALLIILLAAWCVKLAAIPRAFW